MEGPECTRQLMVGRFRKLAILLLMTLLRTCWSPRDNLQSKDVNTSDSSRSSIVKWGALLVDSEWARLDMPIIRAPSDCTQPCMHAH